MKLSTDNSEKKKKIQSSGDEVENNVILKRKYKQNKANRTLKLNDSKMGSIITDLKPKRRNKHHRKGIKNKIFNNSEPSISAMKRRAAAPADAKPSHTLLLDKVQSSISAMLQLKEVKSPSKAVPLFMDQAQPVYLEVECIRIPKMYNTNFRFSLPHPLIDKSSDVCLFVPDLKKGKNVDHEPTVEYYKDILEKNNISGISQVMPLRQVRVEYDQHELRCRLVNQFDVFLSDGRIAGHMLKLLGKHIYKRRKLPVPVNMGAKNLKNEMETALSKTLMMMNARGNKSALKVGHTNQSVQQIAENIMAVANCIAEHYPGGWANVRSLHICLTGSPLIPVYITLKSSNEVEVPIVKPVKPKKAVPVEGELSTFPGTRVTVMPSGEIIVKKMQRTKEEEELDLSDSDWEDSNFDNKIDTNNVNEVPTLPAEEETKIEPEPDSEEEQEEEESKTKDYGNEHVAETAEDAYLNQWRDQWNANIEENNKKRKQNKAGNEAAEVEPKKKKQKIVNKKKKQKVEIEETKTMEKKKQRKRILKEPQSDSKEHEQFKKSKSESRKKTHSSKPTKKLNKQRTERSISQKNTTVKS